jgi:hypothetical protein
MKYKGLTSLTGSTVGTVSVVEADGAAGSLFGGGEADNREELGWLGNSAVAEVDGIVVVKDEMEVEKAESRFGSIF